MKRATIDDKWIASAKPIMQQFASRDFSNLPKYQVCFMSAISQAYSKMLERIGYCIPIQESGIRTINEFFIRCRNNYPNTEINIMSLDLALRRCQDEAKQLNYDVLSSLNEEKQRQLRAYQRYVEEHREKDTQNQVQSLLYEMQTGIIQKTHHLHLEETARQLLICDEQFHDAVNDVFVEYVLERFKSGKEDKVIQALAQQPTRFFEIVRSAAQRNVMLPLLLIAKYCPAELVIRKTRAYVYKYRAEINLFNKAKRKAFVQELKEILEDRCREEKSIRGKSEKKRIEVTGFSKELINVIDAADKNGGKIKLYIIAICAVALVLVGILAAVFLLGSGENEKDDTQESTGVEDSNSTDVSRYE